MKIDTVIFDWSGVISDDRKPVYEANMSLLRYFEKPTMDFEEWLPKTTMTPIEFLADNGVYGDREKLFGLFKKYLDDAIIAGIVPTVYADAADVFTYLKNKGLTIAILSSHPPENLTEEAEKYKLKSFLDFIKGGSKNKTEGLKSVCEKLGKNQENALYVGDTVYDIQAAKGAGLLSAGICTGYHTKDRLLKEKPDFILNILSDIKKII
ncbi:MAG: HAD family hydrolase [Candidatus Aenigmarchaeota archaeon]|nr:HAD family hydrolase [Candidatus Aenigmarchaeota archaeon]